MVLICSEFSILPFSVSNSLLFLIFNSCNGFWLLAFGCLFRCKVNATAALMMQQVRSCAGPGANADADAAADAVTAQICAGNVLEAFHSNLCAY